MVGGIQNSLLGLQTSSANVAKAANNIADPNSKTEVTKDILDIKVNEQNFKANALVLETTKELHEELIESIDIEV